MKRIRSHGENLEFEINLREKALLLHVLREYPCVPGSHHRLSKNSDAPGDDDNQRLLEESLASHREENRKRMTTWLTAKDRFKPAKNGFHFALERTDLEWLLQVLNDVRVGNWIALGSPDLEQGGDWLLDPKKIPYARTMEIAGAFQMFFLNAANG